MLTYVQVSKARVCVCVCVCVANSTAPHFPDIHSHTGSGDV
jgi:hypothetical protein